METLTFEQIKILYPNQWVLVGNPKLRNPKINGAFAGRFVSGIVLSAHENKRILADEAKKIERNFEETACLFTGNIVKKRIFLL